jgi:hypothetical protein
VADQQPVLIRAPTLEEVIERVAQMPRDKRSRDIASRYGLEISRVAWEDAGRSKGSEWGPCVSDMTLDVNGTALPLIRYPNYEDLTW